MGIIKNFPTKLEKCVYMYIFIYICLYLYLNLHSILYIKLYFIFKLLKKWIHTFMFVFIFIWQRRQVRAPNAEMQGQFRPGWHGEGYGCKNAGLITWV